MKRYVFITNGSKPTDEKSKSREIVKIGNVRKPCIETAHKMGYEIWVGVNREKPEELKTEAHFPVYLYDSHTYRSIFAFKDNYIAYKNLMNTLKKGNFEVIHCNTPIGGMVGRLCGKICKIKKVIYTAHGFHFYKGAPLFNRTILKWAEMLMAHWTDAIITMNEEDFNAAKKFKIRGGGKAYFVHGVGIDLELYKKDEEIRKVKRAELNIGDDDVLLISMGDLIDRKNYPVSIKAMAKTDKNVHYIICGRGPKEEELKKLAQDLNVSDRVHFLGFRTDVKELLSAADIFLFSTIQEGLPRSMMEAMAMGLPCIASRIRGNTDLLSDNKGGFLCDTFDDTAFSEAINKLSADKTLREKMGKENLELIKPFASENVKCEIEKIYQEVLNG